MLMIRLYLGILFFSFIVSLPLLLPYFHSGYFPTHDGEWAVVRAAEMFREIRDGQFPARVSGVLNFSYGYPLFNFVYPLPYYIATIFHVFKIGFVDSIKVIFATSIIASAFFMFLLSWEIWKSKIASAISVVFYTYLPYHLVDLFVRGSLGEAIAFALFPLLLLFTIKLEEKSRFFYVYITLASLGYALLITAHNIMAVLFSLMLLIFITVKSMLDKKIWVVPLLYIAGGLFISSFFWVPALFEKQYIALSKIPIADRNLYFVRPEQLFSYRWGYAPPTGANGFSYQIGIAHIIGYLLVLMVVFVKKFKLKTKHAQHTKNFAIITGILVLLLFSPSKFVWENTPLLREINYPWVLLLPIGFLLSILAGFLATQNRILRVGGIMLAVITIVLYARFAKPENYVDRGDNFYLTNEATTTSSDELMPIWVKEKPKTRYAQLIENVKGEVVVRDIAANSKEIGFTAVAKDKATIAINRIYYPGWTAMINGTLQIISYDNEKGIMQIDLLPGEQSVKLLFSETPMRKTANIVSLVSIIGITLFTIFKTRRL